MRFKNMAYSITSLNYILPNNFSETCTPLCLLILAPIFLATFFFEIN